MGCVRILVVDDDRAVRDALRRALTLGGYEVVAAEGGQQALTEIAAALPDAVVLDVGMPGMDGIEVCRRLRGAGNRVPVLMLTARDAVSDRIDGLDAGADDYLVKPFDVGELKARLRALLRRAAGEGDPDAVAFEELQPRQQPPRRGGGRRVRRAHPHRVPAARAADAQPAPGAAPVASSTSACGATTSGPSSNALRVYIGYLRRKLAARGRPPADPHRSRRRATRCASREPPHPHRGRRHPGGGRHRAARGGDRLPGRARPSCAARSTTSLESVADLVAGPRRGAGTDARGVQAGPSRSTGTRLRRREEPYGGATGLCPARDATAAPRCRRPAVVRPRVPVDATARRIAADGTGENLDRHDRGRHAPARAHARGRRWRARCRWHARSPRSTTQLSGVCSILVLVSAGGVALAAGLGVLVARTALAPIGRFTSGTEAVAADPDVSRRMEVGSADDELSRLARSFNATLDALERSVEAQRQLVADASHELRTPMASLRANIQTLEHARPAARRRAGGAARRHRRGARRAHRARGGRGGAGARVQAQRGARRRAAGRGRGRGGGSHPQPGGRRRGDRRRARARGGARRARAHPARGVEPARERGQVEPAGRLDRGGPARRRADACATTVPGSPRTTCATCSSASTAPTARAGCPARVSASRSCKQAAEAHGGTVEAFNAPGRRRAGAALVRRRGPGGAGPASRRRSLLSSSSLRFREPLARRATLAP